MPKLNTSTTQSRLESPPSARETADTWAMNPTNTDAIAEGHTDRTLRATRDLVPTPRRQRVCYAGHYPKHRRRASCVQGISGTNAKKIAVKSESRAGHGRFHALFRGARWVSYRA